MRISDWSSDVCSSDLLMIGELRQGPGGRDLAGIADDMRHALRLSNAWLDALVDLEAAEQGAVELDLQAVPLQPVFVRLAEDFAPRFAALGLSFQIGRESCRDRVWPYVSISVGAVSLKQ